MERGKGRGGRKESTCFPVCLHLWGDRREKRRGESVGGSEGRKRGWRRREERMRGGKGNGGISEMAKIS